MEACAEIVEAPKASLLKRGNAQDQAVIKTMWACPHGVWPTIRRGGTVGTSVWLLRGLYSNAGALAFLHGYQNTFLFLVCTPLCLQSLHTLSHTLSLRRISMNRLALIFLSTHRVRLLFVLFLSPSQTRDSKAMVLCDAYELGGLPRAFPSGALSVSTPP